MRLITGGLLLVLLFCSQAVAQITGTVEMIGFDGRYRPACWTPMLVRLQSTGAPTGLYELRVWQHDLDGDLPYFSTRVTLTAGKDSQPFWTYFIPEPIRGGLTSDTMAPGELQQRLRITVHDSTGKELAQIPVGPSVPMSVDRMLGPYENGRDTRFVVFVGSGVSPPLRDYDVRATGIVGLQEDLESVRITPDRLPESANGFEGVDAVVWLQGDPATLSAGGSRRLDALRDYVTRGGHLVLCTPPQWQQLNGFDDLMPVDITGTTPNQLQSPVREITGRMPFPVATTGMRQGNPWDTFRAPITLANATLRPGAIVDQYADQPPDPVTGVDQIPWLVRKAFGYGCVSWVAQDLADRELTQRANWGWPLVWERVLGSASAPIAYPDNNAKSRFQAAGVRDAGATVLEGMNLTGRGATLISVTILFFIGYWLLAGPGAFFWLKFKNRSTLNWFVFGAVAVGATGVTLGVVRLILRGAADVRHISLVRVDGERRLPTMAISRIGVYVPRDGPQHIEMSGADRRFASTLTPFPIHPMLHQHRDGDRYLFPAPREYRVDVPVGDDRDATSIDMPFRTTMKRLRARWYGQSDERVEGGGRLMPSDKGYISGTIRNLTGRPLRNVYVAFRHQTPGSSGATDWMMFIADWENAGTIDLAQAFNPPAGKTPADITVGGVKADVRPNSEHPVRGQLQLNWLEYFKPQLQIRSMGESGHMNDLNSTLPTSVPLLSFFGRYPAMQNDPRGNSTYTAARADLHRSGLRDWDVSNALMAGKLVIVAQADDTPLPMPMQIDGTPMNATGQTIYQFIQPLTPIPAPPASQPATRPATAPTTAPVS